jgi:hypothetical protein
MAARVRLEAPRELASHASDLVFASLDFSTGPGEVMEGRVIFSSVGMSARQCDGWRQRKIDKMTGGRAHIFQNELPI